MVVEKLKEREDARDAKWDEEHNPDEIVYKWDNTSRHRILDAIECIKNCEAIVSHCNEIMDSIHDNVSKNDKAYDKYMNLNHMREIATNTRRKVMRKVFSSFDKADHEYWCILKHAVAAKWFIDEVVAADEDWLWSTEPQELYQLMSLAISSFIWEKPQLCARCMADDLLYGTDDKDEDAGV